LKISKIFVYLCNLTFI